MSYLGQHIRQWRQLDRQQRDMRGFAFELPQLLASLKSIPPSDAARYGKLHAWLPDGSRVFFVWDGSQYQAVQETAQ